MAMRRTPKSVHAVREAVQRRAAETKENTCSGNPESPEIPILAGYGCTRDAALEAVLAKLMTYVEANRIVKCPQNKTCRAEHECITVIADLAAIEQKVTYNLARLSACPKNKLGYEAVFIGTVETLCVCAPTVY
jgi:hypothetical protein